MAGFEMLTMFARRCTDIGLPLAVLDCIISWDGSPNLPDSLLADQDGKMTSQRRPQ